MCGLFGIVGPGITKWDLSVLDDLCYISGLRGLDGTGIFQGDILKQKYTLRKNYLEPSYFKWFHRYDERGDPELMNDVSCDFFLGHVRAATKGDLNDENCHPFEFDKIAGMHNGTLNSNRKYDVKGKTDSELLIKDINDNGIIPVLEKLDPKRDAFALVLFNKETRNISMVRNNQRPLYVCFHERRGVMYYASEGYMLRLAMARNGEKIRGNTIHGLAPERVYTFSPDDMKAVIDIDLKDFGEDFTYKTFKLPGTPNTKGNAKQPSGSAFFPRVLKGGKDGGEKGKAAAAVNIKKDKIPREYCLSCQSEMNLVDQYYGKIVINGNKKSFLCEMCSEWETQIPDFLNPEHKKVNYLN